MLYLIPGEVKAQRAQSEPPPIPPEFKSKRTIQQISESEFLVEIQVQHSGYKGYAKIADRIPKGFDAYELVSSNGIFSFRNNEVKVIWMQMPQKADLLIQYRMKAVRVPSGDYTIKGDLFYARGSSLDLEDRDIPDTRFFFDNVIAKREAVDAEAIAREEAYQAAIRKGQTQMGEQHYMDAKKSFEKALELKPSKREAVMPLISEANRRQNELTKRLAGDANSAEGKARAAAREKMYEKYMRDGDMLAAHEDIGAAIGQYELALGVKPDDLIAERKIAELLKSLEDIELSEEKARKNEMKYNDLMAEGDGKLVMRNWDDAIVAFSEASVLKPKADAPRKKIEYARRKRDEMAARNAVEADKASRANEYRILLSEANLFFNKEDYGNARKLYEHALRINPEGVEAQLRIDEIDEILSAIPFSMQPTSAEVDSAEATWDKDWERAPRSEEELLLLIAEAAENEDDEFRRKRKHQKVVVDHDHKEVAEKTANGTMEPGLTETTDAIDARVEYTDESHLTEEERARLKELQWDERHRNEILTERHKLEKNKEIPGADLTEQEEGLVYRVQIASSKTKTDGRELKVRYRFSEPVVVKEHNTIYRYQAGYFDNHAEAKAFQEQVRANGATGAFIVITLNGKRISLDDALLLESGN